jgi:ribosomal protein S18 acetylase RimI-like enzyme
VEILSYRSLSPQTVAEIRALERLCKEADGLKGKVSLDSSLNITGLKGYFLAFEAARLTGLLSAFVPSTEEAEISAFTDPAFRRQGLFYKLLAEAAGELERHAVKDIIFVCESGSKSGRAVIKKLKADYSFTECSMNYSGREHACAGADGCRADLIISGSDQLDILVDLRRKIFGDSLEDSLAMMKKILGSDKRQQYLLFYQDQAIGLCSASFEETGVSIHGLGVLPDFQGKGFGRELLQLMVKDLLDTGHHCLNIDVDSNNSRALALYQAVGFSITVAYDYYRLSLQEYLDRLRR